MGVSRGRNDHDRTTRGALVYKPGILGQSEKSGEGLPLHQAGPARGVSGGGRGKIRGGPSCCREICQAKSAEMKKANRPVNDNEVLAELDRRTRGYGAGVRLARDLGLDVRRLHTIKSGNQPMSPRVAAALGWELRWVRKGVKC